MSIILRQEKINERWYAWVTIDGLNCIVFEDDHEITESEAEQKLLDIKSEQITITEVTDGATN